MPLTIAQMLALLPDNTAGDIGADDVRDVTEALFDKVVSRGAGADDINWDGSDVASMTTVTVTGTQTPTESDGLLSVAFSGQSAEDLNCLLTPVAVAIGDACLTSIRLLSPTQGAAYTVGVVLTDGTAGTSNAVFYGWDTFTGIRVLHREGTLTNMAVSDWQIGAFPLLNDRLWIRVEREATNTFRGWFSPDGISWTTTGKADASFTLTPTHAGICWSAYGNADTAVATFGPLRFVTV